MREVVGGVEEDKTHQVSNMSDNVVAKMNDVYVSQDSLSDEDQLEKAVVKDLL